MVRGMQVCAANLGQHNLAVVDYSRLAVHGLGSPK